jgi:hypothetical protein
MGAQVKQFRGVVGVSRHKADIGLKSCPEKPGKD